jgi:hypothetical protein
MALPLLGKPIKSQKVMVHMDINVKSFKGTVNLVPILRALGRISASVIKRRLTNNPS